MKSSLSLLAACLVALAAQPAPAGLISNFSDDFNSETGGLNSTYWTVTQTTTGLFNVDTTSGNVHLSSDHPPTTHPANVEITLNLAAATGATAIAGDFSVRLDFSGASLLGSGLNQAELHTFYQDGKHLYDVRSNDLGQNSVHVWNGDGALHGYKAVNQDYGTFVISRTGSILSGYYDGALMFDENESSALTKVSFVLQNFSGTDPISIAYDNFSLTTPSAVPEPSSLIGASMGLAALCIVFRRRDSRTVPRGRARPREN